MALKKITEQATNDYPKKSAYVLVTQNDADSQGIIKESLRRVPVTPTPTETEPDPIATLAEAVADLMYQNDKTSIGG